MVAHRVHLDKKMVKVAHRDRLGTQLLMVANMKHLGTQLVVVVAGSIRVDMSRLCTCPLNI
jgi:hypothetical protein